MSDSKKERIAQGGFVLFWLFLFFQLYVSKSFREPYPAIAFPAFAQVIDQQEELSFNNYEIYLYKGVSDSVHIEKKEFFSGLPHQVFTSNVIYNIRKRQEKDLKKELDFRLGLFRFSATYKIEKDSAAAAGLQHWLQKNISQYYPDRTFNRAKLFAFKYTFDFEKADLVNNRSLKRQFTIPLSN
jgi:hypothetical protein